MYMYTYYVNRDMQTIIETVSKIFSGAGLLFAFFFKKGLRPLFGTVERPRTQEKQERHRHTSRKSVWMKRLVSLSSVKSSNCAVKLQKFTDFKSLDIVPSITGHRCHGSLCEYFQYMQSKSEQSKHILSTSLTSSLFP